MTHFRWAHVRKGRYPVKSDNHQVGRLRGLALVLGLAIAGLFVAPAAQAARAAVVMNPGDTVYGGGHRCAVGANVTNGTGVFFVLTGDCAQVSVTWYAY